MDSPTPEPQKAAEGCALLIVGLGLLVAFTAFAVAVVIVTVRWALAL